MKNVVCLRHPSYCGKGKPELSCKTCCEIYIAQISSVADHSQNVRKEQAERWLITKYQRQQTAEEINKETITLFI